MTRLERSTPSGQQNADKGLYYLRARYYDPEIGRFLTRDLLPGFAGLPASQNPYAYVMNNPVNYVDPSGLFCGKPCEVVAEKVGGAIEEVGGAVADVADTGSSVHQWVEGLGYVDVGITGCLWICLTLGSQFNLVGAVHPYVGGGFGNPQLGVTGTFAPGQSITPGINCGVQVFVGAGLSGGYQIGAAGVAWDEKEGGFTHESPFVEVGGGLGLPGSPVNVAATCIYVSPGLADLLF